MTERKRAPDQVAESRIPEFRSREEEAEWWDTHDVTDYLDELKPVRVRFAKHLSEGLTIRLDPDTLAELRARARARGVGPTTLIRMWILEGLQAKGRQRPSRP